MADRVLITGGAGFIGSHVADELLRAGYSVRALDVLVDQVHGGSQRPDYLNSRRRADSRRRPQRGSRPRRARGRRRRRPPRRARGRRAEHVPAGRIRRREHARTAVLMAALAEHPVRKLVTASSMSIYGEGAYEPVPAAGADARAARAPRVGAARPRRRGAHAGPDPGDETARPLVGLRADEVRPGAALPALRRVLRRPRGRAAPVQRRTARARRSPTRTPACSRSSPLACSTTARRSSTRTVASAATSST